MSTDAAVAGRERSRPRELAQIKPSALHLLHRAGQRADEIWEREAGADDVTPRQYSVLAAVKANGGASQTDLVEVTGIDRSTLADIVRRLQRKGLLARRRTKEDARAYAVKLTEEGARVLHGVSKAAGRTEAAILKPLSPSERDTLADLLVRVSAKGQEE